MEEKSKQYAQKNRRLKKKIRNEKATKNEKNIIRKNYTRIIRYFLLIFHDKIIF
jgi:hypothetical protein